MTAILKLLLALFLLITTTIIVNSEAVENLSEKFGARLSSFRDMAEIQADDPFSMPPVGEQLNCDKVGLNCPAADCQWLDWYVEYNKTLVNATAIQEINIPATGNGENVGVECFSRCQRVGSTCTAYTFNQRTGVCRLFSVFRLRQITTSDGWSLGYRAWPSPTILGEWIVTRDIRPLNPPLRQVTLDNSSGTWMTCLDLCTKVTGQGQGMNSTRCIVAVFDLDSRNCSLYSSFNSRSSIVEPRVVVMQHYSSFTDSNQYRFSDLGNIAPVLKTDPPPPQPETNQETEVSTSFDAANLEDCFHVCLEDSWYCVLVTVTTTGKNTLQCTLYSYIPDRFEVGLDRQGGAGGGSSDPNTHQRTNSYLLTYPKNYNNMHRLPYFVQVSGTPLYQVTSGGLNECWGRALDYSRPGRAPWWWLTYNSVTHHCSLYPEQIDGMNINPAGNGPEGPLQTFSNRRPLLSSTTYYAFDTFWISPAEMNGQVLGQNQGQLSLENCLQRCVNSSKCAGVARTPRDNSCIIVEQAGLDAIINRNETDAPVLYTMQIFEKRRDLRALEDIRSPYRCYPRPDLNNAYSTVNRSNPFLKGPRLDQFRRSLPLNKDNEWLEPHGANFNGSSQFKLSSFQQLGSRIHPPTGTGLRQSSLGRNGFRQIVLGLPNRKQIPDLSDNVDLPHRRVGGPQADTEFCMVTGDCATLRHDANCSQRCASFLGAGADLRSFLSIINAYVKKRKSKSKRKSKQNETGANPNPPAENSQNSCKCFGTPEAKGGKLISPDEYILHENCDGKRIGQECPICCLQAYRPLRNPRCRCSAGVPTEWDDNEPVCAPIDTCVSARRTWGGQEMVKLHMRNCNNFLYFAISFNYRRKIPFYGVSKWTPLHRASTPDIGADRGSWVNYPCTEELTPGNRQTRLFYYQVKQADYDRLNNELRDQGITFSSYHHGHVVALADSAIYRDSAAATMRRVNAAPQDDKANNAWNRVEGEVRRVLDTTVEGLVPPFRSGYIITGTCWSNNISNPVPACYWKIACTRILVGQNAEWRVAAFFHRNVITLDEEMQNVRRREMYQKRDPQELVNRRFLGPVSLAELWDDVASTFNPLAHPSELSDRGSIESCKTAPFDGFPEMNFPTVAPVTQTTSTTEFYHDELRAELDEENNGHGIIENESNSEFDFEDDVDIDVDVIDVSQHTKQISSNPSRVILRRDPEVSIQSQLGAPPICGKKVVGYVTAWSDVPFTSNTSDYLTHAIFTYAEMLENGTLRIGSRSARNPNSTSSSATITMETRKAYVRLYEMQLAKRESKQRLQTMFSVGGWDNSQYFSRVIADPALTQNFIRSVNNILDYWDMDGIDIDYEYPVTGGATPGTPQDRDNFVQFLNKLRYGLIDHGVDRGRNLSRPYLLTISGPLGAWILDPGFDLPKIASIVDWINVMTYDYFGPWDSVYGVRTGPIAPLYFGAPPNANYSRQLQVDFTMKYYSCHVGDNSKLVMGLGFYGRYWNNSGEPFDPSDPLWRRAIPNSQGGFDGGFLPYSLIKRDFRSANYSKYFHRKTLTPYILSNVTTAGAGGDSATQVFFLAYENQNSIVQKVFYAATKNFGGVAIRSVDYDDSSRTLLRTASSDVLCSWGPTPEYKCPPTTDELKIV